MMIGRDILTARMEEGTLLIHMERNIPSDMMPRRTYSGLFPKGFRMTPAIRLEMRCFSRTVPMLGRG